MFPLLDLITLETCGTFHTCYKSVPRDSSRVYIPKLCQLHGWLKAVGCVTRERLSALAQAPPCPKLNTRQAHSDSLSNAVREQWLQFQGQQQGGRLQGKQPTFASCQT